MGNALVKKLHALDYHLICVSRAKGKAIEELMNKAEKIDFIPFDLSNVEQMNSLIDSIFAKIDRQGIKSVHLINNAGTLSPMKPIDRCETEEIITSMNVNLMAPMLLTSRFIQEAENLNCDKRVINISSGAGSNPVFGWSCYGAAKAGVNMMSQIASLEQLQLNQVHPVQVVSFAPGIIDTDMQAQIRSSNRKDFAQVDRFIDYKEEGKLLSPEVVASVVAELLTSTSFPNGELVSVSDYL
ncbi:MAG: (S)-benzoin forming benzil reductase [Bacillus sp. (in: Bacteria)]|nr:(S)-benzoin forming benzil reductase [Bacillus sp. (in: firmicutes)]